VGFVGRTHCIKKGIVSPCNKASGNSSGHNFMTSSIRTAISYISCFIVLDSSDGHSIGGFFVLFIIPNASANICVTGVEYDDVVDDDEITAAAPPFPFPPTTPDPEEDDEEVVIIVVVIVTVVEFGPPPNDFIIDVVVVLEINAVVVVVVVDDGEGEGIREDEEDIIMINASKLASRQAGKQAASKQR
jgi:hypothetical protein